MRGVHVAAGYFYDVADGYQKPWADHAAFWTPGTDGVVSVEHIVERHAIVAAVEARLQAKQPLELLQVLRLLFDWDGGNLELTTANRTTRAGGEELAMVERALDGGPIVVEHLRSALGAAGAAAAAGVVRARAVTDVAELGHSKRRAAVARRKLLPKKTITKAKKARAGVGLVHPALLRLQAWRKGLQFKKYFRQVQRGDVAKAAATAATMGEYLQVTPPLSAEAETAGVMQEARPWVPDDWQAPVLFPDEVEEDEDEEDEVEEEVEVDWDADWGDWCKKK